MNSLTVKRAMQIAPGDIILRHPGRPEESGEWTVKAHHALRHTEVIDYVDADGADGRFVVSLAAKLLVRLPETLTADERPAFYQGMSESEFWGFVAHVQHNHPATFDPAAPSVARLPPQAPPAAPRP